MLWSVLPWWAVAVGWFLVLGGVVLLVVHVVVRYAEDMVQHDGHTPEGLDRWRCTACGGTWTSDEDERHTFTCWYKEALDDARHP